MRHDKQVAEKAKKGFFTLDDKTKSTDPENVKLFKKRKSAESDHEEESKELKPKRAVSSYIYFATQHTAKLKLLHPEVKQSDLMAMTGKKWNEMLPAERKPYDDMNASDKLRQEKQQKSLDEKGYFLLEDGSKSNDEKNIPVHKKRQPSRTK